MKETCQKTGLAYETLKFYCNQGLVPNVKRDSRNHRVFDDGDVAWINSLTCLKPDRCLSEGDELSLRGSGKLRILTVHGETRKNRLALTLGVYE